MVLLFVRFGYFVSRARTATRSDYRCVDSHFAETMFPERFVKTCSPLNQHPHDVTAVMPFGQRRKASTVHACAADRNQIIRVMRIHLAISLPARIGLAPTDGRTD